MDKCPNCGATLIWAGPCLLCPNCLDQEVVVRVGALTITYTPDLGDRGFTSLYVRDDQPYRPEDLH